MREVQRFTCHHHSFVVDGHGEDLRVSREVNGIESKFGALAFGIELVDFDDTVSRITVVHFERDEARDFHEAVFDGSQKRLIGVVGGNIHNVACIHRALVIICSERALHSGGGVGLAEVSKEPVHSSG